MGTYTANYQMYMPTVGENGWGTLINGNFETIDTTMNNFNTRIVSLESIVPAQMGKKVHIVDDGNSRTTSSVKVYGTYTSNSFTFFNGMATNTTIYGTLYWSCSADQYHNFTIYSINSTGKMDTLVFQTGVTGSSGILTIPEDTMVLTFHANRTESGSYEYDMYIGLGSYTLTYES